MSFEEEMRTNSVRYKGEMSSKEAIRTKLERYIKEKCLLTSR